MRFATRAIHAGQAPDPTTGAIMMPIYQTSTYVQESPGKHKGYDYSRSINPTRSAYERCVADLESGTRGWAFASGLAAMATALDGLDSGSHVVVSDDLYGGTFRLFDKVRKRSANLDFTQMRSRVNAALSETKNPKSKKSTKKSSGSSTQQSEDVNDSCAYDSKIAATARPYR